MLVTPADNAMSVGFAGEVSAAARRVASRTNINQPVVHFRAIALLTSWKLVWIRPSLLRSISVSGSNIVHSWKCFTNYFHFLTNIFRRAPKRAGALKFAGHAVACLRRLAAAS